MPTLKQKITSNACTGVTLGAVVALVIPANWVAPIVFTSLGICIVLAWIVSSQSGAIDASTFRFFGWPFKPAAELKPTRTLWALLGFAIFTVSTCATLLLKVI